MNIEKIRELESAMKAEQNINVEIKELREQFEKEHEPLFLHQSKIREQITSCKEVLKIEAIDGYNQDGNKKRIGGIGIRIGTSILYEEELAFNWSKEHSLCLQLNKKEFEKIAKTQDIDFVKKEEKVTVTFPKEIKLE